MSGRDCAPAEVRDGNALFCADLSDVVRGQRGSPGEPAGPSAAGSPAEIARSSTGIERLSRRHPKRIEGASSIQRTGNEPATKAHPGAATMKDHHGRGATMSDNDHLARGPEQQEKPVGRCKAPASGDADKSFLEQGER